MRPDPTERGLPVEATAEAPTDKLVVTIVPAFNAEDGFVPIYYALQYGLVCLSFWERGHERRSFEDMIQHAMEKGFQGCVFDPPPSPETTSVEVLVDSKEMTARSPAVHRNWDKLIDALNDKRLVIFCARADQDGFTQMNSWLFSQGVPICHPSCDPKNADGYKMQMGRRDKILEMLHGIPPPVLLMEMYAVSGFGSGEAPVITLPDAFRDMEIIDVTPEDGLDAVLEEMYLQE